MAHTYLIAYWLLPETFFKGKYWMAFGGILVFLVLFSVLELVFSNEFVFKVFDPDRMFGQGYLNPVNIIVSGIGNHYIILVFLSLQVGRAWYTSQSRKDELLQIKLETELEVYRYQLQPKLVLTLVEELETVVENAAERVPDLIVAISNFLNCFLFEAKEELIPLSLEVKLMGEFLEIHKTALDGRLSGNLVVDGKLQAHVVPPLLLLPFINSAVKVAYGCNNSFESTVIIKAEMKYLLFKFSFWSETDFKLAEGTDAVITKKRLKYNFPGRHRLMEVIEGNFVEYSLEIFN